MCALSRPLSVCLICCVVGLHILYKCYGKYQIHETCIPSNLTYEDCKLLNEVVSRLIIYGKTSLTMSLVEFEY
jgi:hypothetical protein